MKLSKRLPALLLVLALAFISLALPAFAEDPDPAMPVITAQPQGARLTEIAIFRKAVTLSVEAYIPNGDEIGYDWYKGWDPIDKHDSSITLKDDADAGIYYVKVYNKNDPTGHVVQSRNAGVWLDKQIQDTFKDIGDWFAEIPKALGSLLLTPFLFFYDGFLALILFVGMPIYGLFQGLFTGAFW